MEAERMGDAGEAAAPEPGFTPAFGCDSNGVIRQSIDLRPVELVSNGISASGEALGEEIPEPGFTSAFLYEPTEQTTSTSAQLSANPDHEPPAPAIDHESPPAIATPSMEAAHSVDTEVPSDDPPNEVVLMPKSTTSEEPPQLKPEMLESNAQDTPLLDHEKPEAIVSSQASTPEPTLSVESAITTPSATEALTVSEVDSPAQEQAAEATSDNLNDERAPATQPDAEAKKTLSFFSSLGGSFAPEIQSAWSLVFGSQYEDDYTHECIAEPAGETSSSSAASANGRESLKARLARERRLDAQIQACQAKGRARSASANSSRSEADQSSQRVRVTTTALRKQNAPVPLEHAGLSLTRMRFCVEHALRSTCLCFQDLYTRCMEDDQANQPPPAAVATASSSGAVECGIYVTQYELERLLQTLSRDSSELARMELESPTPHIPLTTLLQASWFLPFDHFSRLRSLVLQVTRRHLNEQKLALLNRQLQRQILLQPLPVRLQQLLLQMSDPNVAPTPAHFPLRPLLEAIGVAAEPNVVDFIPQSEFMELAPDELMQRLGISSVLTLQRVVFFRFLLAAMTTERRRRTTCTPKQQHQQTKTKTDLSASQVRPKSKQTTRKRRLKPSAASTPEDDHDDGSEQHSSTDQSSTICSLVATGGSLSPDSNTQKSKLPADPDETPETNAADDPRAQQIRSLFQQLAAALDKMRLVNPWIEDTTLAAQNLPLAPAIKATYVAASAFQQSVALMVSQKLLLDPDVEQKLQDLVVSLSETLDQTGDLSPKKALEKSSPSRKATDPAIAIYPRVPRATPSIFPPPYLERAREPPDPIFPPVYVSTRPSSWHFTPEFPESSTCNQPPVQPASLSTLKPPGVGTYDVQRSDLLRFSQTPSFSFAGESSTPQSRPPSSSRKKPSICKTSLARAVAIARSPAVSSSTQRTLETPEDDWDNVDQQLQDALRLQQKLFMEHLVHDLVVPQPRQKPQQPSRGWKKSQSRLVDRIRRSVSVNAPPEPLPSWAKRKQPIASPSPAKIRPQKPKSKGTSVKPDPPLAPAPPLSPQRDGEDPPDDDHLAWAARIRESYQQRGH